MSIKPKAGTRERNRAECVECKYCGAQPRQRCTGPEGFAQLPHAVRVARSNGLLPCPQRGSYSRPTDGIAYSEAEVAALESFGGLP